MTAYAWWFLLALALGIVELLTGTLYLLVLAVALAAAGCLALLGAALQWQALAATAIAVVGWLALRRWQGRRRTRTPGANRDVILDIGERVRVERWDADGRARVSYRGADWTVELDPAARRASPPEPGEFVIRGVVGNRLIVGRAA